MPSTKLGLESSLHASEELQLWPGTMLFFSNGVENSTLFAGPHGSKAVERVGYYDTNLLPLAQREGINTWWVDGTYSMKKMEGEVGGEPYGVIAFGHDKEKGEPYYSRDTVYVSRYEGNEPE